MTSVNNNSSQIHVEMSKFQDKPTIHFQPSFELTSNTVHPLFSRFFIQEYVYSQIFFLITFYADFQEISHHFQKTRIFLFTAFFWWVSKKYSLLKNHFGNSVNVTDFDFLPTKTVKVDKASFHSTKTTTQRFPI